MGGLVRWDSQQQPFQQGGNLPDQLCWQVHRYNSPHNQQVLSAGSEDATVKIGRQHVTCVQCNLCNVLIVQCAMQSVQCVNCTLCNAICPICQCTMCSLCNVLIVECANIVQCSLCNAICPISQCTMCSLCNVQCLSARSRH